MEMQFKQLQTNFKFYNDNIAKFPKVTSKVTTIKTFVFIDKSS